MKDLKYVFEIALNDGYASKRFEVLSYEFGENKVTVSYHDSLLGSFENCDFSFFSGKE